MPGQNEALLPTEGSLIERLAHQVGVTANAKCIYGEPVDRDGVAVIPVAKSCYGFGGGFGGQKEKGEGGGGGGGVMLTPVGYIEIKNGETRFRPTLDRSRSCRQFSPPLQ